MRLDARRRPVRLLDRGLRRVEHGRGRGRRGHHVGRAAARMEGQAAVAVAGRERLVLDPRDGRRPDPRYGAHRVDHPVREALGQVHRGVRAQPGDRRGQLAARQIEAGGAGRPASEVGVVEGDREGRVVERQSYGGRRRLQRDVDAGDPIRRARLLAVRESGHGAVRELLRPVLRSLPGEIERSHALLLTVRAGRESGVGARHHERVIVAERRVREIVHVEDREDGPLRRDERAGAPDVARILAGSSCEKEHPSPRDDVGERAARRLPANVGDLDLAAPAHGSAERVRQGLQIRSRRGAAARGDDGPQGAARQSRPGVQPQPRSGSLCRDHARDEASALPKVKASGNDGPPGRRHDGRARCRRRGHCYARDLLRARGARRGSAR